MRKGIGFALIIVSVIMAVVACQPDNWWEDYWWPDNIPEKEAEEILLEEFAEGFDLLSAIRKAVNESRYARIENVTDSGFVLSFSNYNQGSFQIRNGRLYVSFDGDSYSVETLDGLFVRKGENGSLRDLDIIIPETSSDGVYISGESIQVSADASMNVPANASFSTDSAFTYLLETESEQTKIDNPSAVAMSINLFSFMESVASDTNKEITIETPVWNDVEDADSGDVILNFNRFRSDDILLTGRLTVHFTVKPHSSNDPDYKRSFDSYVLSTEDYLVVETTGGNGYGRLWLENVSGSCDIEYDRPDNDNTRPLIIRDVNGVSSPTEGIYKVNDETVSALGIYGDGSEDHPIIVYDAKNLVSLLENLDSSKEYGKGVYIKLNADISMAEYENLTIYNFAGSLDGGNHVISDLRLSSTSREGETNVPLINELKESGTIKNIVFEELKIENNNTYSNVSNALIGENHGSVENVHVRSGNLNVNNGTSGMLIAENYGVVRNVSSRANVIGNTCEELGGLVGLSKGGLIEEAVNYGNMTVSEANHVGGIVGYADNTLIDGASNECEAISLNDVDNAGGIAGSAWSDTVIKNAYNKGDVTGDNCVGGIVGYAECNIFEAVNEGTVSGEVAGGIAGRLSGVISHVFNDGDINSEETEINMMERYGAGGIAGNAAESSIYFSENRGEVTSSTDGCGGIVGTYSQSLNIFGCANKGNNESTVGHVGGILGDKSVPASNFETISFGPVSIYGSFSSGDVTSTEGMTYGIAASDFAEGVTFDAVYWNGSGKAVQDEVPESGIERVADGNWSSAVDAMNSVIDKLILPEGVEALHFTLNQNGLPELPAPELLQ